MTILAIVVSFCALMFYGWLQDRKWHKRNKKGAHKHITGDIHAKR